LIVADGVGLRVGWVGCCKRSPRQGGSLGSLVGGAACASCRLGLVGHGRVQRAVDGVDAEGVGRDRGFELDGYEAGEDDGEDVHAAVSSWGMRPRSRSLSR
jgi:hypothetical protein